MSGKRLFSEMEINSMKKNELLFNLQQYGVRGVSNLNKDDLSNLFKHHVNRERVQPSGEPIDLDSVEKDLEEKRRLFDSSALVWSNDISKISVPKDFTLNKIDKFLTSITILLDDEQIHAGTEKPAVKGRRLYLSEKIQYFEFTLQKNPDLLLTRCNMEASMKSVFR